MDSKKNTFKNATVWSEETEEYLTLIKDDSERYILYHKEMTRRYQKYENILYWLLQAITGAGLLLTVIAGTITDKQFTSIIVITAVIDTALAGLHKIQNTKQYELVAKEHRKFSLDHENLVKKIKYQLSLTRTDRQPPKDYLEWIRTHQSLLIKTAPEIDFEIMDDIDKQEDQENRNQEEHEEPDSPYIPRHVSVSVDNNHSLENENMDDAVNHAMARLNNI